MCRLSRRRGGAGRAFTAARGLQHVVDAVSAVVKDAYKHCNEKQLITRCQKFEVIFKQKLKLLSMIQIVLLASLCLSIRTERKGISSPRMV